MEKEAFVAYQEELLAKARRSSRDPLVSEAVADAFLRCPRHEFVETFFDHSQNRWIELTLDNLDEHLEYIYEDEPLTIYRDKQTKEVLSTISQPTFVLQLLQLLDLKPGHSVFELGTGSGWNAAMIADLVGNEGRVVTVEIVAELALAAANRLKSWPQAKVLHGDGASPELSDEEFDRVIFTAGSYDVPSFLFQRVKEGGLFVFVLRNDDGPDVLFLFQKIKGHFHSLRSTLCRFVGMQHQESATDPFLKHVSARNLSIEDWSVDVYPAAEQVATREGQWLSRRKESQFVWTNPGDGSPSL